MLAGLLFANHDAEDRPDRLIATLPFAGSTLIEYQARQLIGAGAAQLIVVADRLTPDLLGAMSRIGRRGVSVDAVRSADEAAEKLHPLACVLVLADGLVATDMAVGALAREGGDALLVVPGDKADADYERVGGRLAWAGVARVQPQRVAEVAALPRDYDMQSALVRAAEQAGATHLSSPADLDRQGHGFAFDERTLAQRGRRVVASLFAGRTNWFDRWIVAPVARSLLPVLVARGLSGVVMAALAALLGIAGCAALIWNLPAAGAGMALVGSLVAILGETLAALRGEDRVEPWLRAEGRVIPLVALLVLGWTLGLDGVDDGPLVGGIATVVVAALAERAIATRALWWGSPIAYLLPVVVAALAGAPLFGTAVAGVYAAATLGAAIEDLRTRG
ncbi:hypothetical protein SAMN05192583_2252 [Sphingomonas gellani]|uniref:Uncharacterized protein n=1 Tax=Sphingomonas gellani TaxID=1166340 RepID=A0A1H8EP04_9SPHN|nr:hypothetical protein [Sphingomonas gellani]SEN21259.1 hypothetical protein SAMN05192583_2252 [Sphingomonas gellani]